MEWAAFWLAVVAMYCASKVPSWIQARSEASCAHDWEELRSGDVVENIGESNAKRVGSYDLYRCKKCGASREYR